ncbi:MAG: hypothetical protein R3E64_18125 [Halioglobus sp.]
MKNIAKIGLALGLLAGAANVYAGLIVAAPTGSSVVDFSQFNGNWIIGTGPIEVGGLVGESISWQSSYSSSVVGSGYYGLAGNGSWTPLREGYVGLNTGTSNDYMDFVFGNAPVASVGGLINYSTLFLPAYIEIFGDAGQLLESINISSVAAISTPGESDAGDFRGISRAANDIYVFRVRGAFAVLDDLSFSRNSASVATPGELWLFALGLLALICFRRRTDL